jgi:hypothetical protein
LRPADAAGAIDFLSLFESPDVAALYHDLEQILVAAGVVRILTTHFHPAEVGF